MKEINEKSLFNGVSARKYHSAILTTFTIDLAYFDNQIIGFLKSKNIFSYNLLVDERQLNNAIHYIVSQNSRVGKDYTIAGIKSKGAFHPKACFFIGDNDVLVLFGSGNLTAPGLGKNHELFSGFCSNNDDKSQMPLILELFLFISTYANTVEGYFKTRISDAFKSCSLLNNNTSTNSIKHQFYPVDGKTDAALLYNDEDKSIIKQLIELIPNDEVKQITILSPYFDYDGRVLDELLDIFKGTRITVLIQESCQLPPANFSNARVQFLKFESVSNVKSDIAVLEGNRFLHAKMFHFVSDEFEYCMIGSANATCAAIGVRNKEPINIEMSVLYKSNKRRFLSELGLNKSGELIDIHSFNRAKVDVYKDIIQYNFRIISADYINDALVIYYEGLDEIKVCALGVCSSGAKIVLFENLEFKGDKMSIDMELSNDVLYLYFTDSNGKTISNISFINRVNELNNTNPIQSNRRINEILSDVEINGFNGSEVVKYLSELISESYNMFEESKDRNISSSCVASSIKKDKLEKDYIGSHDIDEALEEEAYNIKTPSNRLFECINQVVADKVRLIKEEMEDEEEDGSAYDSAVRNINVSNEIVIKTTDKAYLGEINRVVDNFLKYLKTRNSNNSSVFLSKLFLEDTNIYAVVLITLLDVCYINKDRYVLVNKGKEVLDNSFLSTELLSIYEYGIFTIMNNFIVYVIKYRNLELNNQMKQNVELLMPYIFLYAYVYSIKMKSETLKVMMPKIKLCLINYLDVFSKPAHELMNKALINISAYSNEKFKVSDVINFYDEIAAFQVDGKIYRKWDNYGIRFYDGKKWVSLEYALR